MRDPLDLSTFHGELEALEVETFEVLDYQATEDLAAIASTSCGGTSTHLSTSTCS